MKLIEIYKQLKEENKNDVFSDIDKFIAAQIPLAKKRMAKAEEIKKEIQSLQNIISSIDPEYQIFKNENAGYAYPNIYNVGKPKYGSWDIAHGNTIYYKVKEFVDKSPLLKKVSENPGINFRFSYT